MNEMKPGFFLVSNKLKGVLLACKYDYWKHDPYPLILVSSVYRDNRIAGVNLRYLTFNYIMNLIKNYCNKNNFNYQAIKGDRFIANAFRTYKVSGIKGKIIDRDFFINMMASIRTYSPNEVAKIRSQVQEQIRQKINVKADDLTPKVEKKQPNNEGVE